MIRHSPDGVWYKPNGDYSRAISILSRMSDEERMKVFSHFCTGCGEKNLPCYCGSVYDE